MPAYEFDKLPGAIKTYLSDALAGGRINEPGLKNLLSGRVDLKGWLSAMGGPAHLLGGQITSPVQNTPAPPPPASKPAQAPPEQAPVEGLLGESVSRDIGLRNPGVAQAASNARTTFTGTPPTMTFERNGMIFDAAGNIVGPSGGATQQPPPPPPGPTQQPPPGQRPGDELLTNLVNPQDDPTARAPQAPSGGQPPPPPPPAGAQDNPVVDPLEALTGQRPAAGNTPPATPPPAAPQQPPPPPPAQPLPPVPTEVQPVNVATPTQKPAVTSAEEFHPTTVVGPTTDEEGNVVQQQGPGVVTQESSGVTTQPGQVDFVSMLSGQATHFPEAAPPSVEAAGQTPPQAFEESEDAAGVGAFSNYLSNLDLETPTIDATQRISDAHASIDTLYEQAARDLGRQFSLEPDPSSGSAIDRFERLSAQKASDKAQATERIRQQANAEKQELFKFQTNAAMTADQFAKNLAFQKSDLAERARQYDNTYKEGSRQFNSQYGLSVAAFAQGQFEFESQMAQRMTEYAGNLGLSQDQFIEAVRQFDSGDRFRNRQLDETIRQFNQEKRIQEEQFAQSIGLSREQFKEAKRQFNADLGLKEDELFGGGKPMAWNKSRLEATYGKAEGEQGYNPEFDLNDDGVVNLTDFIELTGNSYQTETGMWVYRTPGRTLAAQEMELRAQTRFQELGIEKKKFEETKRQFDATFQNHIREYESNFAGVLFDEDGAPVNRKIPRLVTRQNSDGSSSTFYEWVEAPISSLEKDHIQIQMDQFNRKMNKDWDMFLAELGLKQDQLDNMADQTRAQLIASLVGAWAQYRAAAGQPLLPGLGGGRNVTGGGYQPPPVQTTGTNQNKPGFGG